MGGGWGALGPISGCVAQLLPGAQQRHDNPADGPALAATNFHANQLNGTLLTGDLFADHSAAASAKVQLHGGTVSPPLAR